MNPMPAHVQTYTQKHTRMHVRVHTHTHTHTQTHLVCTHVFTKLIGLPHALYWPP